MQIIVQCSVFEKKIIDTDLFMVPSTKTREPWRSSECWINLLQIWGKKKKSSANSKEHFSS